MSLSLAQEAVELSNQGRHDEAIKKFKEAIAQNPKNASLYVGLGLVYQTIGRYREAVAILEQAVGVKPSLAEAHYSLALLYEALAIQEAPDVSETAARDFWRKAGQAWNKVLQFEKDPKKKDIARKHIKKIQDQKP